MGLLDDLKNQAEGLRQQEENEAAEQARRDKVYMEEIRPRLVKAYQYFHELVKYLNYVKPEILVDYPLYVKGNSIRLRQGDYAVVSDSSEELKRIDIILQCSFDRPAEFEIAGKDLVLSQSDRLDRYGINHKRRDRKDASLELEGARFSVEDPLPVRIVIEGDLAQSVIRLQLRNFTDPGSNHYSLKPADFDESFLDRLGKFLLRKEVMLFDSHEMSEEALQDLRHRLQEEKAQRDRELREMEEALRAEQEAQQASNKTEVIKQAVLKTVDEKKAQLKDLFNKLKAQARLDKPPGD
jgi:hypothetical protein